MVLKSCSSFCRRDLKCFLLPSLEAFWPTNHTSFECLGKVGAQSLPKDYIIRDAKSTDMANMANVNLDVNDVELGDVHLRNDHRFIELPQL